LNEPQLSTYWSRGSITRKRSVQWLIWQYGIEARPDGGHCEYDIYWVLQKVLVLKLVDV